MPDATSSPPVAAKRPQSATHHGITLHDDYAWLRDPGYPKVEDAEILAHLEAENAWFEARMAPHAELVEKLFQEFKGRIKEDDSSVPQRYGDFLYWVKFEEGAQYPQHYRRPVGAPEDGSADQLLLDEVALAEGHEYFVLGQYAVTRDGSLLAYATDTDGSERYTVRVKDLTTGELLPDAIPETLGNIEWVEGNGALVYGHANEHWRTESIRLHRLGTPVESDIELYHEDDDGFRAEASLSAQEDWLIIATGDHETSEVRLVPAADPTAEPILVRAREAGVEYDVDVRDGTVWVHTNDEHMNFRLATAPLETPGAWKTAIAGSDSFYLSGFALFAGFLVSEGRLDGLDQIRLHDYADLAPKPIQFPEASYVAGLGDNPEYDVETLRLSYQSMVTPGSVYDYDVATGKLELLKRQEIPSGYFATLYTTERLRIRARDGTVIPVSVMQRRDRRPGGPLQLYAYGAYGHAYPPGFSITRLSLINRGMAFAIAHIRGGDDMGRGWYLAGKRTARWNTFTDFVDVAEGLVERGYTSKGRISISGGSAGGQLMGVVANTNPELWGAVVADVPFVDCLNTMLDESLPLTPGEWPEWGDPVRSKQAFAYIMSYSPYDQVAAQNYPPMLVTGGLNDPRVTYWEPAKWVARLRELKTDGNELLLKTNMGAGHGGKSGRFESIREVAEQYAFILWQLGLAGTRAK